MHEVERNQAVRLCRHLLNISPSDYRPSLVYPFVAVAGDGALTNERMLLSSLEFLCELGNYIVPPSPCQ